MATKLHRKASLHKIASCYKQTLHKMSSFSPVDQWRTSFDQRTHSASCDFRSDTVTLPTGDMLSSILQTAPAFGDDVFSEDEPTNSLERYVESLTGLKNGIFVLSGTMGNQIALRCLLTQPPHSVVLDRRSHIFEYECGMASMFSQAQTIPVMPKSAHLSLEDITPNIVPDDGDTHGSPTRVIALENTCWGKIMPLHEVRKISQYAHAHGIKVHLDGARLWNACYGPAITHTGDSNIATAKAVETLKAYCAEVDTVSLCFSKSLGAPVGSMVLARDASLLARGRHFRKALGGGMRQTGVLTSAARVAIDQIFLAGKGLLKANTLAKRLQDSWVSKGGHIQQGLEQETNMVWIDLKKAHVTDEEFVRIAEQVGVKVFDGRIVTHYLPKGMIISVAKPGAEIAESAVDALERAFESTLKLGKSRAKDPAPERNTGGHSYSLGRVPGE